MSRIVEFVSPDRRLLSQIVVSGKRIQLCSSAFVVCASSIEFKLRTRGYLIQWRCIINKSTNSAADDARLLGVSSGNLKNPIGPTVENMLLCLGFIT